MKKHYIFNYHGGQKVRHHTVTPEFVERVRAWVRTNKLDLVITEGRFS